MVSAYILHPSMHPTIHILKQNCFRSYKSTKQKLIMMKAWTKLKMQEALVARQEMPTKSKPGSTQCALLYRIVYYVESSVWCVRFFVSCHFAPVMIPYCYPIRSGSFLFIYYYIFYHFFFFRLCIHSLFRTKWYWIASPIFYYIRNWTVRCWRLMNNN